MPKSKPATVTTVPLSTFKPAKGNARRHDQNAEVIKASLERFGAARSVVVDKGNTLRAGHGTLAAAKAAGFREAVVVEVDGKQLVVVKRTGWDKHEAEAYSFADNRSSDLSKFDYELLAKGLAAAQAVDPSLVVGFDQTELAMLLSADWKPDGTKPLDEFTREGVPVARHLVIEAAHAAEVFAAVEAEQAKDKCNESEAVLRIVRRASNAR